MYVGLADVLDGDSTHHLHSHGSVDEEDQTDQEHDPRQGLEKMRNKPSVEIFFPHEKLEYSL